MLEVKSRKFNKVEGKESFVHLEEERLVGFDIDIIDSIKNLKELGAKVEQIINSFAPAMEKLAMGIRDYNADLAVLQEAKESVWFEHELPDSIDMNEAMAKVKDSIDAKKDEIFNS